MKNDGMAIRKPLSRGRRLFPFFAGMRDKDPYIRLEYAMAQKAETRRSGCWLL
jgi:hypothetical protein